MAKLAKGAGENEVRAALNQFDESLHWTGVRAAHQSCQSLWLYWSWAL